MTAIAIEMEIPKNRWNNAAVIFAVIEELSAVDTKANLNDGNIIIIKSLPKVMKF